MEIIVYKRKRKTCIIFERKINNIIVAIEIIGNGSSTGGFSTSGLYFVYTMDLVIFFFFGGRPKDLVSEKKKYG